SLQAEIDALTDERCKIEDAAIDAARDFDSARGGFRSAVEALRKERADTKELDRLVAAFDDAFAAKERIDEVIRARARVNAPCSEADLEVVASRLEKLVPLVAERLGAEVAAVFE